MSNCIHDCKIFELPKITGPNGSITPIYSQDHIPFKINRVYYLYDVPGGVERGGHAHKQLQQLFVSVMGAFDVILRDGTEKKRVRLDRASRGLYIPRMIWRELVNFSSGGICLVLASMPFQENDYIRDYQDFMARKLK